MPSEHIRIPAVDPVARYQANGEQTSFAYPFPIFEPENLEVYLAETSVGSGFTVTGAGETEGGQVVFATAPAAGTVVTLRRRVQAERATDFQESGDLRAKVLNDQFDHLTAAVQDVAADVTRCIRVPASESIGPESLALPPASARRNKWLGFDADGHLIVAGVATSGGGGAQGGLPPAQVPAAGGAWGEIGGTLSAQADLWSTLAAKADSTHNHDAAYVPAGHAGSRGASHGLATTTIAGFMAPEDKVKLNGIAAGAEINLTPTQLVNALNTQLGGTAWQSSGSGGSWGGISGTIADQTDLYAALAGKAATIHSHSTATIQAAGFLSAADKTKLDGIEAFASADMTASEIVDKVNEALGGTSWQSGDSGSGSVQGDSLQAMFINTVNGATISAGSEGNINFDSATFVRASTSFTAADGEITINDTGKFFIESDVTINLPVANVKGSTPIYLQSNASGSWQTLVGGEDVLTEAGASAQSAVQNCTGDVCAYLELTQSGTKVRVRAAPQTSYNNVVALAKKCHLRIYKIIDGDTTGGGTGGGGSPVTWYDEQTQLGQQTKVKFTGAGVGAAVNGDTVEVTIAAQAAAAGGADTTVQFNSGGASAGAAGIKVKSPANGPGHINHILHANTYTGGCAFETVAAGAGWWADSYHDVAYDVALQGSVTLKGSVINVQNNNEISSTKAYLRNTTSATISVTIDTGDGHFTEIIGLSNPFSIDANATKIVYLTARKDASGAMRKAVEG